MTAVPTTVVFTIALALVAGASDQHVPSPELLEIRSGPLVLRAQVWRPAGGGRFPAVLFNHGSYGVGDPLPPNAPETIGRVFARRGYVFMWLHRRGIGMSHGQGVADGDLMSRAQETDGVEGRNRVQLRLLDHDEMDDAIAALARLRALRHVDPARIAIAGHSFGGSLSLLMAARDPSIRALVIFSGAAGSWNQSPALRDRLLASVRDMSSPALFIHADNDYSTSSGKALAAELQRLGKRHELKIYPPYGEDARAGHNMIFGSVATWEADVFAFLDEHLSALSAVRSRRPAS